MSESRRDIVWIASYPKSGNTWVRFMLCSLLYGRIESAAALNQLAPDIHESSGTLATRAATGLLVKAHYVWSPAMPLAARSSAAIYVLRDPADVFASNYHYYLRRTDSAASPTVLAHYLEQYLRHRGDPHWRERGMGSWDENVRSWLGPGVAFPVVCVRYEDLSANPQAVCAQLAQLLKPGCTAEDIARAVADASFERMREVEAADIEARRVGIFYKPYLQSSIDAGARFMRRGAAGEAAGLLTGEQQARLLAVFQPLVGQLGYPAAA
jgi:aryl sulfotransferase